MLLLPSALEAHVLSVEGKAARLSDVSRFHRDDDVIARASDRAGPGIPEAVFELELQGVAGNLRGSLTFRRRAMAIDIGGVESDLHRVAGLFDAQLKDRPAIEEFLVAVFAGPTRSVRGMDDETSDQCEKSSETGSCENSGRSERVHKEIMRLIF